MKATIKYAKLDFGPNAGKWAIYRTKNGETELVRLYGEPLFYASKVQAKAAYSESKIKAKMGRKKPSTSKRKRTVVSTYAGVRSSIKKKGAAGRSFRYKTKTGNTAIVRFGKNNKKKVFRKTVKVMYTSKTGRSMMLVDTRIRKRVPVKRKS
jgi:hypothetical protein